MGVGPPLRDINNLLQLKTPNHYPRRLPLQKLMGHEISRAFALANLPHSKLFEDMFDIVAYAPHNQVFDTNISTFHTCNHSPTPPCLPTIIHLVLPMENLSSQFPLVVPLLLLQLQSLIGIKVPFSSI
jgi:hypothetical protein